MKNAMSELYAGTAALESGERVRQIRKEMPAVENTVYLNTGTCGPLPRCTVSAMQEVQEEELLHGRIAPNHYPHLAATIQEVKEVAADILVCDSSELALCRHTTDGMNLALAGYPWQTGDEILLTNIEHPSGLLPSFLAHRRFGANVRVVDIGLGGGETGSIVAAFEESITSRTRMLVLSHIPYTTGAVLPLKDIVSMAHDYDVLVIVDGAQSFGQIPLDLHDLEVDYYACPGQKWMCGPEGTGLFYARAGSLERIEQTFVGPFGMRQQTLDYLGATYEAAAGAARFDVGGMNLPLLIGQMTSMRWIREKVGLDWAAARIAALGSYAYQRLSELDGVTLVTPAERMAGLITFVVKGIDAQDLSNRLHTEHNVIIRYVDTYINNPRGNRLSAGFYNTVEDIDRLVEAIAAIRRTGSPTS
ncbi:MAG: aminotransferase class V-fold PLP-dependent enzyme [Ktedonobacterales bacterium]